MNTEDLVGADLLRRIRRASTDEEAAAVVAHRNPAEAGILIDYARERRQAGDRAFARLWKLYHGEDPPGGPAVVPRPPSHDVIFDALAQALAEGRLTAEQVASNIQISQALRRFLDLLAKLPKPENQLLATHRLSADAAGDLWWFLQEQPAHLVVQNADGTVDIPMPVAIELRRALHQFTRSTLRLADAWGYAAAHNPQG